MSRDAKPAYDEMGNPIESTKGKLGGECGKLSCSMPEARWLHGHLATHVCEWCAKDANRAVGGICVLVIAA